MVKYNLYLEFWSKEKKKEKVFLIIEREFKSIREMMKAERELSKILGDEK